MFKYITLILLFNVIAVSAQAKGTFEGTEFSTFGDVYTGVLTQHILVKVVNPPDGSLVRITPRDLSQEVVTSGQVLTFIPDSLQFSPSVKEAAFQILAKTDDPALIQWVVSNTAEYEIPANTSFTPSKRPILISDASVVNAYVGLAAPPLLIYTEFPPLVGETTPIEIEPNGDTDNLAFLPSLTLNYDLSSRSGFYIITARTAALGTTVFDYVQHGGIAVYDIDSLATTVETKKRNIEQPQYPAELTVGQTYFLVMHTDIPPKSATDTLTITPRGAGLTFTPSTINLSSGTATASFNITVDFPANNPSRLISYSLGGSIKTSYNDMADDVIVVKSRSFDFSTIPSEIYLGEGFEASVCTLPAPVNDVTLFMVGNGLTFNGNANERVTLTSTNTCAKFTVLASITLAEPDVSTFSTFINFIVEGADQEQYGKPADIGITIKKREFAVEGIPSHLYFGQESTPISVTVDRAPSAQVILTPKSSQGNLIFTPATLAFDSTTTALWMTVTAAFSNDLGNSDISFEVGGSDGLYYATPGGGSIDIRKYSFQFTNVPADIFVKSTSDPSWVNIDYVPPNTEVVLTPSAADFTFTPSQLTFTPSVSALSFTITCDTESVAPPSRTIEWIVSGGDGNGYSFPGGSAVALKKSGITIESSPALLIGTTSKPLSIVLDKEPNVAFTITPASVGLTFTPSAITFNPGQLSHTFQITANSLQHTDITWSLSDTAVIFAQPPQQTVAVGLRDVAITPSLSSLSLVSGVASPPITVELKYGPPSDITLVPKAANLVFSPATISFSANQRTATFTVTYNQDSTEIINVPGTGSGFAKVTYDITGGDKDWYLVPADDNVPIAPRSVAFNWPASIFTGVSSYPVRVDVGYPYPIGADLTITPRSDVVTFTPSTIQITAGSQSSVFILTANLPSSYSGNVIVTYDVSGTDALHFTKPTPQAIPVSFRKVVFDEEFLKTTQLAVGIESRTFSASVTAPVDNEVTVTPISNTLSFSPATFTFSSSVHTVAFTVTPTAVSFPTEIIYSLTGRDAKLFENPGPHGQSLRVTHQWNFASLPTVNVDAASSSVTVAIGGSYNFAPVTIKPFAEHTKFDPAVITFTDSERSVDFTVTSKSSAGLDTVPVVWSAKEMSEDTFYVIQPKKYFDGFAAPEVHVIRDPVLLSYPENLQLNSEVDATFSVTKAPETEVSITPYGNNMEFTPPVIVFTATRTSVAVKVKALYDTTGNTHNTPYRVYYRIGGADAQNYLEPAETIHWVA